MKKLLLLLVSMLSFLSLSGQCVMCKASVELQDGEQVVGGGINEGILFLMPIPYIILGTIAYLLYKKHKQQSRSNG